MRHFARRLFALCCVTSLVLCVAVCGLWVRSAKYRDSSYHVTSSGTWYVQSSRERLLWLDTNVLPRAKSKWWDSEANPGPALSNPEMFRTWLNRRGFYYRLDENP